MSRHVPDGWPTVAARIFVACATIEGAWGNTWQIATYRPRTA